MDLPKISERFDYKKLLVVGIIILILWLSVLFLFLKYGKELRTSPCSLCAEKIGKDVRCATFDGADVRYYDTKGQVHEYPLK